jgi:hypothetical protein
LWYAAINGQEEMIKMLVEKGASVDFKTLDGDTPLHGAASGKILSFFLFGIARFYQVILFRPNLVHFYIDIHKKTEKLLLPVSLSSSFLLLFPSFYSFPLAFFLN